MFTQKNKYIYNVIMVLEIIALVVSICVLVLNVCLYIKKKRSKKC